MSFSELVDLSAVERIRESSAKFGSKKPTYTAFVAMAAARALEEFPYANRRAFPTLFGFRIQTFRQIDIAVAVERDLPNTSSAAYCDVIRGTNALSLREITAQLTRLASTDVANSKQWRQFNWIVTHLPAWLARTLIRLQVYLPRVWEEHRGGALLVSSPAKYGVDAVSGTWPLGVSFGYVEKRAVVRNDQVVPAPTFQLFLNWDRRLMAGAQAAWFFRRIVEILESPSEELLL